MLRLFAAAAVVAAVAAGTTYATTSMSSSTPATNTIQACVKDNGDIRISAYCASSERAVSWNVVGPAGPPGAAGKDGLGVQSSALGVGSSNCPFGGSSFVVGIAPPTFACNGAPGADGANGKDGTDGKDGKDGTTFTSIDGL